MSRPRVWSSTSRRLAILLFALVLPPAVTLIWLGAQLLEQDRDVIAQREEARRTVVGHAVAAEMQRSLAAAEQLLEGGPVPDGLARFVVSDDRLEVVPSSRLLWTPAPNRLRPAEEGLFELPTRLVSGRISPAPWPRTPGSRNRQGAPRPSRMVDFMV